MALSDSAIRKAKPADKPLRLFDGGGLYLEISPSGGKLRRLKYRFAGKEKRLALGIYPNVSLAEAREARGDARRLLAQEIDPGEHRKEQRTAKADRATNSFEAVAILNDLHALTGRRRYVFPGRDPKKPMSDAAVNAALIRMGYDTRTEITGHGFRAMAQTILHQELGIAPEVIEHQLAHRVPDVLGTAYNRTKLIKERRKMMQQWADYLDKLKAGATVIPLHVQAASLESRSG
jgi:integrase